MRRVSAWVLVPLLATPLSAADWPVFRGNREMTGTATATLPDQLAERWTFQTGNAIEGAPAIVGNVVYVASMDKFLYALDLATGQQKWKTNLGLVKASPAVANGRVYIGNIDGKFHCLDATNGKILWEFDTAGEITAGANFHKENILVGSHDSTLYCLSTEGKKLWEYKIDGPVNGAAAVAGDRTFVAGCDSVLHVIDANTGKQLGTVDIGGQAGATAAVSGDVAYVGTMSNQIVGVDVKAPKKLWEFEPKRRAQPFYSSAAVTEAFVVDGSRDKKIYALDRKTGKEVWSVVTDGMVDSSPVVVGNRVYIGSLSTDSEFFVLDLATGKQIQKLDLGSAITGSVAVAGDCVFVGTDKGTLYCLGAKK